MDFLFYLPEVLDINTKKNYIIWRVVFMLVILSRIHSDSWKYQHDA